MKIRLKMLLSFMTLASLHQMAYSAALAPRPVRNLSARAVKPTDSSINQLIQQIFIDKQVNGKPFQSQALDKALLELSDIQANNLYLAFKALFENIEKKIRPGMIHNPPVERLQRNVANKKIKEYLKHLFDDKKTSDQTNKTEINAKLLHDGIKLLNTSQKQTLQSLLNLILKKISLSIDSQKQLKEKDLKDLNSDLPARNVQVQQTVPLGSAGHSMSAAASAYSGKQKSEKESAQQQPAASASGIHEKQVLAKLAPAHLVLPQSNLNEHDKKKDLDQPHPKESITFLTLAQMKEARDAENEKIKKIDLSLQDIKNALRQDPRYERVEKLDTGLNFPTALETKEYSGYPFLLHAIVRGQYERVSKLTSDLDQQQIASYHLLGLNAYELAAYLDELNKRQSKTGAQAIAQKKIKLLMRSAMASDLLHHLKIKKSPDVADFFFISGLAEKIIAENPNKNSNASTALDQMHRYLLNVVDSYHHRDTSAADINLWLNKIDKLLTANFNVRYKLFSAIKDVLSEEYIDVYPLFYIVLRKFLLKASEQGEPIENIEEILKIGSTDLRGDKLINDQIIERLRNDLRFYRETATARHELEKTEQKPNAPLDPLTFQYILTHSNPYILAIKHAIEDFGKSGTTVEENREKLNKIVTSNLETLDKNQKIVPLVDDVGYTPLLYAVYLNKPDAVKEMLRIYKAVFFGPYTTIGKKEIYEIMQKRKKIETEIANLNKEKEALQQEKIKIDNANQKIVDSAMLNIEKTADEIAENHAESKMLSEKIDDINKKITQLQSEVDRLGTYHHHIFAVTKDGMNAYCLAKHLGHQEIMEILALEFPDKTCPK